MSDVKKITDEIKELIRKRNQSLIEKEVLEYSIGQKHITTLMQTIKLLDKKNSDLQKSLNFIYSNNNDGTNDTTPKN